MGSIIHWNPNIHLGNIIHHFINAAILIVVAYIAYRIVRAAVIRAVLHSARFKRANSNRTDTVRTLLGSVVGYVIFFVALVMVLGQLGVQTSAIIASAGIIGLAIGFGAQGLVSDIVTGFFVLMEGQVNVGEYVTVAGYSGTVEDIGLRIITLRDFSGDLYFIPNRNVTTLANHSRGDMQAKVQISIAYEADIDRAIDVMQSCCDRMKEQMPVIKEGPTVLGVANLGASDVSILVTARTENGQQFAVQRALTKSLKEALDAATIEIPYPHQVVMFKNDTTEEKSKGTL